MVPGAPAGAGRGRVLGAGPLARGGAGGLRRRARSHGPTAHLQQRREVGAVPGRAVLPAGSTASRQPRGTRGRRHRLHHPLRLERGPAGHGREGGERRASGARGSPHTVAGRPAEPVPPADTPHRDGTPSPRGMRRDEAMTKRSGIGSSWPRRCLLFLAVLNTVTALGGAWGLVSGVLDLGPVTSRLPWDSTVVAGIALGLLVALPNAVLIGVALRRGRTTGLVGIAVGTALVAWILVEMTFIRELSFFHPLYGAIGLLMVWAGFRVVRVDLGVPAASLAKELRDAITDAPRFLAAPLMRRRHLRWGATDDEVAATLVGDDRQP